MMPSSRETGSPIVIDGVFFQLNNTGIARLWHELLLRWQHTGIGRRIVLMDRNHSLPKFSGLRSIPCPALDYGHWQEDRGLVQAICDEVGAELFVSTYYTRPERTPSVMFVYDMIPERMGFDLAKPVWRQKHDAIRHASAYAVISQNSLRDLQALFPESIRKPVLVAQPGVSQDFFPPSHVEQRAFHAQIVQPFLEGRPYFLFVSEHSTYKNSDLLLAAFRKMTPDERSGVGVLFTRMSSKIEAFRGLPGLKVHAVKFTDGGLRAAYGSALALVYPSRYEGFGMPPLEAMACGCPVICANTSSLPEVVGEAALLIDPDDDEQLLAAMKRVMDPDIRRRLQQGGRERAKQFSWDRMVLELEAFLTGEDSIGARSR